MISEIDATHGIKKRQKRKSFKLQSVYQEKNLILLWADFVLCQIDKNDCVAENILYIYYSFL